jgi:hypothetical protein
LEAKIKMLDDLPSIARSSEKVVKEYLANVYHAARKNNSAPSQKNQLSSQMSGTVPKWEAAKAAKQRLEEHRDAANGEFPSCVRECHKIASQKYGKAAWSSKEAVEQGLDSLGQKSTELYRYLAARDTFGLSFSRSIAIVVVLLSVVLWPLPWVIFRQILSLIGFRNNGVKRGQ